MYRGGGRIPTRQNFGQDHTERICRRQIKCNIMIISVFDGVENKQFLLHFTHNVFKRLLSQTCQKVLLYGKGLNYECLTFDVHSMYFFLHVCCYKAPDRMILTLHGLNPLSDDKF